MRLARIAIAASSGVVALAAAALGAVAWLLATEAGTAWLVARVEDRIPAAVAIGEVRGTLWSGLMLRDIAIDTATAWIRIDEAALRLDLRELVRGVVSIDELGVFAMSYESIQTEGAADPRAPVFVPARITVRDGSLQRLTVVIGGQDYILGPANFSADAIGDRVAVEDLVGSGMGFDVRGSGELRFGAELELGSDFAWSTTRNELTYAGNGSAAGIWPRLEFQQDVTAPVALRADGDVTFGPAPVVSLEASWVDLIWPWMPAARSEAGTARVTGWLSSYTFDGSGSVSVAGIDSAAAASGSGTLNALEFESLELTGEHGTVSASGRLDFEPLVWRFDVQTTDLNPAARFPDWPGALDVSGEFSGRMLPALAFALDSATISGELREQSLAATGGVAYEAPNLWTLDEVEVELAGNRLSIDGSAGAMLALDISVDATTLQLVVPGAAGTLRIDGHVGGTLAAPALSGTVTGHGLRYADFSAESLALDGKIVADDARTVALKLSAESAGWRDRTVSNLSGRISGTAARHRAELEAVADYGNTQMRAEGSWSAGRWVGALTSLSVEQPTLGSWRLTEPAALAATRGTLDLSRFCLEQGGARLCGQTRVGTEDDLTEIELTSFDFTTLDSALPDYLSVTGRYDARLSLSGPLPRPAGTFEARGTGTVITYREVDEPPLDIPIEELEFRGSVTPAGDLLFDAAFEGGAGARVDVDAAVTELWAEEPGITAEISGRWADLAMLSLLSPDVGEVSGTGSIDLTLGGRLRAPDVRGQARWTGGQVAVPRLGLLVENVEAEVSSTDGTELVLQASGIVGEGQINVAGTTQVDPEGGWPTQLQVYGSGLQAVRLPEAEIVVSPSLEVHAALPNIEVTGAFLVPRARLLLEELPPQAVEPSPDTIVHSVDRAEQPRPLNVHADIRVGLGDDVRYAGAGLDVALSGAMGLVYDSGRDAVASGTVTLSGQYQAYGQTLQIEQGQLLFAGPVANPALDVRAVRRVETTTVGVQLSGTVEAPVTRVFSEPAMSEADALSYLLFGRPLSASGDAEAATLESAAFAMGLQQALPVIQRVGETLGLDEFSVQTTTADTGELMAGKRLSPRLYIRYSYGLFNRLGGLLMRFNLNERFSLETRSGDYRSMDLIYTVERD